MDEKRLEKIEHHIEVINSEMGEFGTELAAIKVNVCWLKKLALWQLGLVGSLVVATVVSALLG